MAEFRAHLPPGDAPVLSKNAVEVLRSRYLVKDRRGECIETPAQLFSRVAWSVAEAEAACGAGRGEVKRWHKRYYDSMASLDFLPNSPALMNAQRRGMLSACFVLPIEDSIEGIFETVYSLVFVRQVLDGARMLQMNPLFRQIAAERGFYSKKLGRQITKTGSIQKLAEIPASVRRIFKAAYDIEPQWHIRMQAAFQQHCDAAVSKTINLNEEAARGAIDKAYKLAYRLGCKGVTVYRRDSRKHEPMSLY